MLRSVLLAIVVFIVFLLISGYSISAIIGSSVLAIFIWFVSYSIIKEKKG